MDSMSIYKYGSTAHAHEDAKLNMHWLGLRTSDVVTEADHRGDDPLIPLNARDRKKALSVLRNNPVSAEDGPKMEWRLSCSRC
jgi:meiotic recombination protein SPO11